MCGALKLHYGNLRCRENAITYRVRNPTSAQSDYCPFETLESKTATQTTLDTFSRVNTCH